MKFLKFSSVFILAVMFFLALTPSLTLSSPDPEDFFFIVPIRLKNIHEDLTEWRVFVGVYDQTETQIIGSAIIEFTVNRNYGGVIEAKFNALADQNPSDGKFYKVYLSIKDPSDGVFRIASTVMGTGSAYPYDTTQPFTVSLNMISIQ